MIPRRKIKILKTAINIYISLVKDHWKKEAIAPSYLPPRFVIDDSSWKNAGESFTVALSLTLGGYVRKVNLLLNIWLTNYLTYDWQINQY